MKVTKNDLPDFTIEPLRLPLMDKYLGDSIHMSVFASIPFNTMLQGVGIILDDVYNCQHQPIIRMKPRLSRRNTVRMYGKMMPSKQNEHNNS